MKILFISNYYPPYDFGGYEQWCAEVATRLVQRGHHIKVLTSNHGICSRIEEDFSYVSRTLHLQSDFSNYNPIDFWLKHSINEKSNIQLLRKEIDQFCPDIIMVWGMWNLSQKLPYWAEQWMQDRILYFISSYWPMDIDAHTAYWNLPANRFFMKPLKRVLRFFALKKLRLENYPPRLQFQNAVCCSRYVRDTLVYKEKLPPRSGVLFGGIDPEPFLKSSRLITAKNHYRSGELNLLYFGRLIYDKGVHTAVEALGILRQRGFVDRVRLTILGSGHPTYETQLRTMAKNFVIEDRIVFVKHVSRNEIPDMISKFDIFLFTSIWPEPMARSVMEAMAAGLLVIGTEVGGQQEMLSNDKNSLTFTPGDANTLAKNIIRVLDDRLLRVKLARKGQKMIIQKFTLERMVDEIEGKLQNIIQAI